MKREILCEPCDKRQRRRLARAFGDFLAPVGEHVKRVPGVLYRGCHCDSCAKRLWVGDRAVAVSMWSETSGGPYFSWENHFLTEPQPVEPVSTPGDFYDRKRTDSSAAYSALRLAQERGASGEELRRLEDAAIDAGNTGD